ncbi:MAG: phosphate-selective porin OprO and OprP [Acidobacteriota bacterium]|nr:phosphate-selective porin OprO and OprP [Acidobacteriota bacterium]
MKIARLTLLLLLLPSVLAAQGVEERLAKLESEVRELREENRALKAQLGVEVAARTEEVAVEPAGSVPKMTIGGFIHAQAESGGVVDPRFPDDNDRFYVRRARLSTQGKFVEHFDFKVEMELSGALGAASGMRTQMTDAFITWTQHPAASLRLGQFKSPYGFEQLYPDQRLPTPERALGTDRLTLGRQIGLQLFGELANKRLTYALGAFNGNGVNTSVNDDEGLLTVGRLAGKVYETKGIRWSVGVDGFRGEDRAVTVAPELGFAGNTFAGNRHGWGVDTQVVAGPVELWVEALNTTHDPLAGVTRDSRSLMVQGSYWLTKKLQAIGRWESFEPSANVDALSGWLIGGSYAIKGDDVKLQLNYVRGEHDDRLIARVQTVF